MAILVEDAICGAVPEHSGVDHDDDTDTNASGKKVENHPRE